MVQNRGSDREFLRTPLSSGSDLNGLAASLHGANTPHASRSSSCTKWRIIQWALFVALVAGVAVGTCFLVSHYQEEEFQQAFQRTADHILYGMEDTTQNTVGLLQTFSLSVSANTPNDAWPYVTIPSYSVQVHNYILQSYAATVVFAPLVDSPTEWERFVSKGQEHQEATTITTYTFKVEQGVRVQDFSLVDGYMAPVWQIAPNSSSPFPTAVVNYNLHSTPWIRDLLQAAKQDQEPKHSRIMCPEDNDMNVGLLPELYFLTQNLDAWSLLVQPILTTNSNNEQVVGFLLSLVPWGPTLFAHRSNDDTVSDEEAVLVVLREEGSGNSFTYRVEGSQGSYLGPGDSWVEEEAYGSSHHTGSDPEQLRRQLQTQIMAPPFEIEVYPTNEYHNSYTSYPPAMFAALVVLLTVVAALVFVIFQHCHDRERYQQVKDDGLSKIESSLRKSRKKNDSVKGLPGNNKQMLNAFLADQKRSHDLVGLEGAALLDESSLNDTNDNEFNDSDGLLSLRSTSSLPNLSKHADPIPLPSWQNTKAVADLFPSATICVADISGFTAWSSVREPSQAFSLLETLYDVFDRLAQRRRIFKVDTIGDCYTAVCGLPQRRDDHAVALCCYARSCLKKFRDITHRLEQKLGPETSELALRVGINSGPIMAGILRGGSSARFQLFGETVTMAAKIEGAGQPGRIHLSKETATQLTDQGKGHWLQRREDKINTNKGELQTFWLLDELESQPKRNNSRVLRSASRDSELSEDSLADDTSGWGRERLEQAPSSHNNIDEANSKMMRLVGWNCEITMPLLKMIVARRSAENNKKRKSVAGASESAVKELEGAIGCHNNVLDEVEEVISLPHYDSKVQKKIKSDPDKVQLGDKVQAELWEYVYVIARLYHSNPFHNFEHASHVTMSTMKLLSRIVAPEIMECATGGKIKKDMHSELHDCTYGITSDPLTQFAVILAALIHDVDHRGVPNFLLCKEEKELAAVYDNKSVAEQNSVDIAWETLMDSRFSSLRQCIYANEAELKRFRVLLVNCVMSTDIFDKELSALRKARWEKAFSVPDDLGNAEDINRKATIVIEHLIQASDVSHTMQHWHVYVKWNERLFHEMYSAYRLGRADKDPSDGWYKGEIWFFDNYVIPLAKKLKDCGVFGVSSDEYLTYAVNNRNEWEEKGQKIVQDMLDKYSAMMDIGAK